MSDTLSEYSVEHQEAIFIINFGCTYVPLIFINFPPLISIIIFDSSIFSAARFRVREFSATLF